MNGVTAWLTPLVSRLAARRTSVTSTARAGGGSCRHAGTVAVRAGAALVITPPSCGPAPTRPRIAPPPRGSGRARRHAADHARGPPTGRTVPRRARPPRWRAPRDPHRPPRGRGRGRERGRG